MSGKPPASRTCWFACQGNRQLPGLADSHVRETISFPDLLSPQSGGRRRCFKSIRAGRNIRDQYVVVEDHEAIGLRIDAGSIASSLRQGDPRQDRNERWRNVTMSQPGQRQLQPAATLVFHWKPVE